MNLETSKNVGGVGALLMLVGVFPYISFYGIVELVGFIMVMAALYSFANYFRERGIFNYALYGLLVAIIGAVLAVVFAILIVLPNISSFITKIYPTWNGDWSTLPSLSSMTPDTSAIDFADVVPFVSAAIVVLVVAWITAIVSAFLFRRSFVLISIKTTVGLFSTAGLLLLIGAALLILLIVPGVIIMWISILLLAIAFFTTHTVQPTMPTATSPPPPTI